ncbi:MAG TPA: hypothetical protein VFE14_01955, partial [Micromonosporaceae bacterium]|nr:hypothetical protein [Micromonosporaceae bacterium]
GVLRLPALSYHQTQDLVLPVMVGTTVLVAVAIAGYARWIGEHALAGAASGLAGPALVAAAYLVAGAGISADRADQQRPWLASLVAVGAGLAASTLVAVVRRKRAVEDDTEPADELTPDTPARTRPVPPPAAPLREDEYVGWVSGLRGSPTEKPRRDSEPDDPTEQLPRPKEPKLHRPYVS